MESPDNNVMSLKRLFQEIGSSSPYLKDFVIWNNIRWGEPLLNRPHRMDGFLIFLCTQGFVRLTSDLKEYTLKKDSFMMFAPSNIIEVFEKSDDYRVDFMIFSREFLYNSLLDMKSVMPIFHYMLETTNKNIQLSPEESRVLGKFFDLLDDVSVFNKKVIIQNLLVSFLRTVGEVFATRLPEKEITKTRQEEYFDRFMRQISAHHKTERSVQFYADALHITPKYLSSVIKDISGKSAADWIDDFVIQEAKVLLKFSTKSVQEIAYYLNFSTQSFFGKYFKRHTGVSPTQYRAS